MGMFWDWLTGTAAARKGYRSGYKRGRDAAQEEATRIISHAALEAESMKLAALEAAELLKQQEKDRGYTAGRTAGRNAGLDEGRAEGKKLGMEAAYNEECRALGLVTTKPPEEALDFSEQVFHWGPHANVYNAEGKYVVRVVVDGQRLKQEYHFKVNTENHKDPQRPWRSTRVLVPDAGSAKKALARALRYRQQLVQSIHVGNYEVLREIAAERFPEHTSHLYNLMQMADIADEYHKRIAFDPVITINTIQFLGEDPGDRFGLSDSSLLTAPWTRLFDGTIPQRFIDAFVELGLGNTSSPRSVRDLLLITPDELRKCNGIGVKSIAQFRQALRDSGLALWSDTPPPAPLETGQRHFRAIHLD